MNSEGNNAIASEMTWGGSVTAEAVQASRLRGAHSRTNYSSMPCNICQSRGAVRGKTCEICKVRLEAVAFRAILNEILQNGGAPTMPENPLWMV